MAAKKDITDILANLAAPKPAITITIPEQTEEAKTSRTLEGLKIAFDAPVPLSSEAQLAAFQEGQRLATYRQGQTDEATRILNPIIAVDPVTGESEAQLQAVRNRAVRAARTGGQIPSVGRIVILDNGDHDPYAAIVVKVLPTGTHLNVCAFNDHGQPIALGGVMYGEGRGRWRWPERI